MKSMKSAVVAMAMLAMGCGVSIDDFRAQANASKNCTALEKCVLAGAAKCLCPTPINSKYAAQVNDYATQVNCGGAEVDCTSVVNVRCGDNGVCIGEAGP